MLEFGSLLSPAFSLVSGLFLLLPLAVYIAPFAILFLWLSHPGVPSLEQARAPIVIKVVARDPWITNCGPLGRIGTDGISSEEAIVLSTRASLPILSRAKTKYKTFHEGLLIYYFFERSTFDIERLTPALASLPPTLPGREGHERAPPIVPLGLGGSWTSGQGPRAPPITEKAL